MRNPFRPRRKFVTDELSWQAVISHRGRRGIVYTDDGGWMMSVEFLGPEFFKGSFYETLFEAARRLLVG